MPAKPYITLDQLELVAELMKNEQTVFDERADDLEEAVDALEAKEVTVTRNLTSGTQIANIQIGNTSNQLYAPTPPTKVSDLTNDSGFISSYTETDPTVPAWAKAETKPSYTASEVGALPDSTIIPTAETNANVTTMLTNYGLNAAANLNAATVGSSSTGTAVVQADPPAQN